MPLSQLLAHRTKCLRRQRQLTSTAWRSESRRPILRFGKDFPAATIIRLEQNYSRARILRCLLGADRTVKSR